MSAISYPPSVQAMEQLTEEISSEIGPKWVQLFSRLKVNYQERYRLCAQYKVEKDRPKHEQEINCARDTIRYSPCTEQSAQDLQCYGACLELHESIYSNGCRPPTIILCCPNCVNYSHCH